MKVNQTDKKGRHANLVIQNETIIHQQGFALTPQWEENTNSQSVVGSVEINRSNDLKHSCLVTES